MSESFQLPADLSLDEVLAVAAKPKRLVPAELKKQDRAAYLAQLRAVRAAAATRMDGAPPRELLQAAEQAGNLIKLWDPIRRVLLQRQGLTSELRELLDGDDDSARLGLLALYCISCSLHGQAALPVLRVEVPPNDTLVALRAHPAIDRLAQEGPVQEGRAQQVRKLLPSER